MNHQKEWIKKERKEARLTILFILLICFSICCAENYFVQPSKSIPAQHIWEFSDKELSKILIKHLKSLGTNVPNGEVIINGLESHYLYKGDKLELLIKEK